MLTLDNFESSVDREILKRGQQYFLNKSILNLEETEEQLWEAEVEGTEVYTVNVRLKDREIVEYSCNCPYDGYTCKHAVSVFLALKKDFQKIQEEKARKPKTKKLTLAELLEKISLQELRKFILDHSAVNKDFVKEFEVYFAEKDERIDMRKHYEDIIKKLVRKHSDHGFIDYKDTFAVSRGLDALLKQASGFIANGKLAEAMLIGQVILSEMMKELGNSDDSNGELGGSLSSAIELLSDLAHSEEVSFALKTRLYEWLIIEIQKKDYYDYGDFGTELLDVCLEVALQVGQGENFMNTLDKAHLMFSGFSSNYYKKEFLDYKIEVLSRIGNEKEIEQLIKQNLEVPEMRQKAVAEHLANKNYTEAKTLIKEGIKLAEEQQSPGIVTNWEKQLFEIAKKEQDLTNIRFYAKKFAFDFDRINKEYYDFWKNTFSPQEWNLEVQKLIADVYKKAEAKSKEKNSYFFNYNRFIFDELVPIFIAEMHWDKLLEILQKAPEINYLDATFEYLAKRYPKEILEMYMPLLRTKAKSLDTRNGYQNLTSYLKKLKANIKDSAPAITQFIDELKVQYARKPAMLEELRMV